MKKGIVLTISIISVCINTHGQKGDSTTVAFQISVRTDQVQFPFESRSLSSQTTADTNKLMRTKQVPGRQGIKNLLNEPFFINGRSGFGAFKTGGDKNTFSHAIPRTGIILNKKDQADCSSGVLSKLSILSRGFPFLISLLTKENKLALKLACQKTSFGASNKACKKVTGITFALPIAITQ